MDKEDIEEQERIREILHKIDTSLVVIDVLKQQIKDIQKFI